MLKQSSVNFEENLLADGTRLTEIFFSGCKTSDVIAQKRVGVEFEKLPVCKNDFKAAPYYQIAKFLNSLKTKHPRRFDDICENNALLGLVSDNGVITLEPGSQTELSLKPLDSIDKISAIIKNYNKVTARLAQEQGILWLGCGIQPVSTYRNINIIPKKRYEYMTKYLPSVARKPLVMMRETAGIQASFDYSSEEDAMKKFAFALKLSPFISAAFANSPIRNGRLTKFKSNRAASWLETDNDRCGLVSSKIFCGEFSFEQYSQILLDVPMIFIERVINGTKKAIKVENLTFRQFIKNGYEDFCATKEDWETHISLYFPDVRFKTYIEIRNHDNQREDLICCVPALWKGLLYNADAMSAVLDILKPLTYFDFEYVRRKTPKCGLDMKIRHMAIKDIVREITDISYQSLKSFAQGEEKYLEPLKEYTDNGLTPADLVIQKYNRDWNCNLLKFVEYTALK